MAIRVAIADKYPSFWLGKYKIEEGRKVAYVSAEEPEPVLHKRLLGIAGAIAQELYISRDDVLALALQNLTIINVWGKVRDLFKIDSNSITPTDEYYRILSTLLNNDIGLLIIDTRSRLSGAEGAGNAIVSREVAFYEQWAAKSGATILILHHTSKASYGGTISAQAAQRGESSFIDCLRFGIYLQHLPEEIAAKNDVEESERLKHLIVFHAKSNYTEIQEPFVIRRDGWKFELTPIKPKSSREEKKSRQGQEDLEIVINAIKENPGINHRGLIKQLDGKLSQSRVTAAVHCAHSVGSITYTPGPRNSNQYFPGLPQNPP